MLCSRFGAARQGAFVRLQNVLCGVDIGGTKLSVGLVTATGDLIDQATRFDHVSQDPDGILDTIAATIGALLAKNGLREEQLLGIGVGTAGHLRQRDGVLITMSNLPGFKGYPLRSKLERRFSAKIAVDNDANAQAYGEYRYGAGRGFDTMVFLTLSTQIGAGIVIDGRVYRGMTGTAGEIGHTIVDPESDRRCPCGNRGCLIAVASGVALPAAFKRKLDAGLHSKIALERSFDPRQVDGPFIARGLAARDEVCLSIVEDFCRYIGIGVYNLFQVLNPQAVVLGGGLVNWGREFLDGIERHARALARDMMSDEMAILEARGGAASGILGAASLVLEER